MGPAFRSVRFSWRLLGCWASAAACGAWFGRSWTELVMGARSFGVNASSSATINNQLRTGADKGNPTV